MRRHFFCFPLIKPGARHTRTGNPAPDHALQGRVVLSVAKFGPGQWCPASTLAALTMTDRALAGVDSFAGRLGRKQQTKQSYRVHFKMVIALSSSAPES
jgi:hypothetical protein